LATLDPGWKILDQGSGINIPDPQHWLDQWIRFRRIHETIQVLSIMEVYFIGVVLKSILKYGTTGKYFIGLFS
jgi:hypothetical protein